MCLEFDKSGKDDTLEFSFTYIYRKILKKMCEANDTTTLKSRFAALFDKNDLTDVQFIVGRDVNPSVEPQTFHAHKLVLSAGSTVFRTMFYGSLPEILKPVELPEVEPLAFAELLRFLYMDHTDVCVTKENVFGTLYVARKYDVSALESCCVTYLKKNITVANVFEILAKAEFYELTQLKQSCFYFIDQRAEEIFSGTTFTDLDTKTICNILERDTLIIREVNVFTAVKRWAEAECSRRELIPTSENRKLVLEGITKLIRFPVMQLKEFTDVVTPSGILNTEEELSILRYFTHTQKPKTEFSQNPRTSSITSYTSYY